MAKKAKSKLTRKQQFVKLVETFGTAMRHTNINHHSKSEEAWSEFAERLWEFLEEDDES